MSSKWSQDSQNVYSHDSIRYRDSYTDSESEADSPIEYVNCLACKEDTIATKMFFCNECTEAFHPKSVLIKPPNDDKNPRFRSWVCADCKYSIEKSKKMT
ncbi:hypothetical protein FCM35_KLT08429 [Carex littledalei]|uniref:PHD-type domain-containing protein n=1 Tax=Carex littledalei TaxID=544730 RepID=A0A833QPD4_9POAL|nr:hypothetical protein FCM35_KLT08429 [Carex littledalei]